MNNTYDEVAKMLSNFVTVINDLINENKRLNEEPQLGNGTMATDLAIDNTIVNAQRITVLEKEIELLKAKLKVVEDELATVQQQVSEWDMPYCDSIPSSCDPYFLQDTQNQSKTYGVSHPVYSQSTTTVK